MKGGREHATPQVRGYTTPLLHGKKTVVICNVRRRSEKNGLTSTAMIPRLPVWHTCTTCFTDAGTLLVAPFCSQPAVLTGISATYVHLLAYPTSGSRGGSAKDVLASYSRRKFHSAQYSDTVEVYYPPVWQWDEHVGPGAKCCAVDEQHKRARYPSDSIVNDREGGGAGCTGLRRPWRWVSCERRPCSENSRATREASRGGFWARGPV